MNATAIAVTQYDEFREKINQVKETCNFIPDVTTKEGYEKSKRVSLDVGKVLTALEKKRKELKQESLEFGRKVDSEAKLIATELEDFQAPHKEAYKKLDQERKEREEKRKAELEERVRVIRELPEAMRDSDSEGILNALESLGVEECLDFYEYTEQALKARNASKEALAEMYQKTLKAEQDAAELDRLRKAEAERLEKERIDREAREAKEREEKIAREAAEKAKREAEEKAERERQAAIEREQELKRQAEKKARLEEEKRQAEIEAAKEREAQLKREAEAAEQRRIKAEQDAKEAEERARLKAKQEAEEKARQEEEARKQREADRAHRSKIMASAKEAFMDAGFDEGDAKKIVLLICEKKVPAVTINF